MFLSQDRIHKINAPIFIIHGKVDEVVPFYHGRKSKKKIIQKNSLFN